jgi:hypothetical protein
MIKVNVERYAEALAVRRGRAAAAKAREEAEAGNAAKPAAPKE